MSELRQSAKVAYDQMESSQRSLAKQRVADLGSHYVRTLREQDFLLCLQTGLAQELVPLLQASVSGFVAQLDARQCQGILADFIRDALLVTLAHWFQYQAHPHQTDGWTLPSSVIISGAINDRLKAIREADRQRTFYHSLGEPSDPAAPMAGPTRSPTSELEERSDLPAEVKVNVLRNYLEVRNREGITSADGVFRTGFLKYHSRSLEAARRFFRANPRVSPGDLIAIVQGCCQVLEMPLPGPYEDDEQKCLRKCANLSYLLTALRQVVRESEFELPVEKYLTKSELFGSNVGKVASE